MNMLDESRLVRQFIVVFRTREKPARLRRYLKKGNTADVWLMLRTKGIMSVLSVIKDSLEHT
jgi:hypothetical protein